MASLPPPGTPVAPPRPQQAPLVPPQQSAPPESLSNRFNAAFTSTAAPPEAPPAQQVADRFAPALQQPLTQAMPDPQDLMFNPRMAQGGVQPDTSNLPAVSFAPQTAYSPEQARATSETIARLNAPLSPPQPAPELAQGPQQPPMGLPTAAVNPQVDPRAPKPGMMAQAPAPAPQAGPVPPFEGPQQDPRVAARQTAIKGIESGGSRDPYNLQGARTGGDRAQGAYQVMGRNVPAWTKEALGYPMTPDQFRGNRNAQDIVFNKRFGDYADKYGDEGAARAWYAGEKGMKNLAGTDVHGRLTVAGYGRDYTDRLARAGADPREAVTAALVQQQQGPPSEREVQSEALLNEVIGGGRGQRGYPATASLGRAGVASDAPLPGIGSLGSATDEGIANAVQQRQRIYNAVQQQQQDQTPTAPEVPQPDPTQSGALPPTTSSASSSPTVTDIAPAPAGVRAGDVVAQGRGIAPAATPPPVAAQPVTKPYEMAKPEEPDAPKRRQAGELEQRAIRMRIANPGDPDVERMTAPVIATEQKKRDDDYARDVERYKERMGIYKQELQTWNTVQRDRDKDAAALAKQWAEVGDAQQKASDTKRFGREPEKFFADMTKQKDAAQMTANVLRQSQLAKEAIKNGIITGFGAERRIDMARARAWAFNNKVEGDLVSHTEQMEAAVKSMLSVAVQNIQGSDSKVSDSDIKVASGTIAADPKLQLQTIEKIINENERVARGKMADYEDQHHHYLSGHAAEKAFEVKAPPSAPPQYIERLLEHKNSREARDEFDKRFGENAAELEIARAKRRQRSGG